MAPLELPQNSRRWTQKLAQDSDYAELPHNLRIISRNVDPIKVVRLLVCLVIVMSLVFLTTRRTNNTAGVLGQTVHAPKSSEHFRSATTKTEDYFKYGSNDDMREAVSKLRLSLENDPKNPYAIKLLNILQVRNNGELVNQIKKVNKILEIRPDYAAAWLRLSLLYKDEGDNAMSKFALERAKKLNLSF